MRLPEPSKPAAPQDPWSRDRFYCVYCGLSFATEGGVSIHAKSAHLDGESATKGEDFAQGWQIEQMLDRWRAWHDAEISRAERLIASFATVEDFLLECENDR